MATATQLAQYCVDHGFVLKTSLSQGKHMTSYIPAFLTVNNLVVGAVGWVVGHWGIRPVATWIYTKVRGLIPVSAPAPTPVVIPVVTATTPVVSA